MADAISPNKPAKKKNELNEQFYTLLKELVETQTIILEKLVTIEDRIAQEKSSAKDPLQMWKDM